MIFDANAAVMYLVRHGATANNVAHPPVLQGRGQDPSLSGEGRRQSEWTARLLANLPISGVFSSPLSRARQTAETIAAPHGLPVTCVPELIEGDVGRWEGRSWPDIEREEPEAYRRFMDDPAANPYAGGETFQQVQDRAMPALKRLLDEHTAKRIVVVAHNIVNRVCLAQLLDIPTRFARRISQHNCGVSVVSCRGGVMKLKTCNSLFHLE